ncbi:MAG TPA: Mur ligase family protein [Candidatus Saccharimonadia bacterium]|nr:Mur ligase family protein [Candidatus Saccharimonadia bacterium]
MTRDMAVGEHGVTEVVTALQDRGRFGVRLGLGRTRALLRALGSPEAGIRGVLVGGTNGKGSVQAMVGSVLSEGGLRVGQTPKPHLVDYRERIVIGGRPLAPADFADVLRAALSASEVVARRLGPPTEFEVLTAAAFLAFARAAVDVAVVEVGLGGRLDATNAWDGGVAAVTNVAFDHMEYLGASLAAIGREKAAIIKRGDRAVTGASGDGLAALRRRATRVHAPLAEVTPPTVLGMDRRGLRLRFDGLGEARLSLLGRHQASNAAVAVGILDALRGSGIADVSAATTLDGLAATRWPGRLELLNLATDGRARPATTETFTLGTPDVLLDGAHNPAGVAAFLEAFRELRPSLSPGRATLVLGLMADKDVAGMVGPLASADTLHGARVITTQVDAPRAMPAADLAAAWRSAADAAADQVVVASGTIDGALEMAIRSVRTEGGPLLVLGSLYLVGAIRGRLVEAADASAPRSVMLRGSTVERTG